MRYQNGQLVFGSHGGTKRGIKIESNISGEDGYTVTIHNIDGNHPVWGNNVQMALKQMRIESETDTKIVLRGFGYDSMGASFADYGMTLHLEAGQIDKAVLHIHDRCVDIEYLK